MTTAIRNRLARIAGTAAFERFVALLEQAADERPDLLRVLTYHRVDEPDRRPGLYPGLISATPEMFERQIAFLANRYRFVSLAEVLAAEGSLRSRCAVRGARCAAGSDGFFGPRTAHRAPRTASAASLPPRAVLVTFDDAYRDFSEQAWPIMKRYGAPATLFVPTAYPGRADRAFWWDRLHQAVSGTQPRRVWETPVGRLSLESASDRRRALLLLNGYIASLPHGEAMAEVDRLCRELGASEERAKGADANEVLDWETLRRLAREGVTLGAHTRTHPRMNRVSLDEAREEAVGSLRDLEREMGAVPPVFAYPAGAFNEAVTQMLGRQGFALAFTTRRGINDLRRVHPLQLRRINVGGRTTLPLLRAQLLPRFLSDHSS